MSARTTAAPHPFPARFMRWMGDRFPMRYTLFLLPFYLSALLSITDFPSMGVAVFGFPAFWCFYLFLRIVDEHRDLDIDQKKAVTHLNLVSLHELLWVGAASLVLGGAWTYWASGKRTDIMAVWLVLVFWSFLVGHEFFQPVTWTYRCPWTFAVSHLLVMPSSLIWILAVLNPTGIKANIHAGGALALLAFLSGALFEVARKTRTPETENRFDYTYSSVWGLKASVAVIGVSSFGISLLSLYLVLSTKGSFVAVKQTLSLAIAVSFYSFGYRLFRFSRLPKDATQNQMTDQAGLLIMICAWAVVIKLFERQIICLL